MESDTAVTTSVVEDSKQSSGKGWKIATIIASVVAVCGIGFGVYGVIQSLQKDNQISDLKNQVENLNSKIASFEVAEKGEIADNNTATTNDNKVTTDGYQIFSNNMAKNYAETIFGYYYYYDGSENVRRLVTAAVDNSHLVIRDSGVDGTPVIAEADGIISVYFVQVGNGGIPYFYLIKKDGSVARIDISDNSARSIENLSGYEKIVSVYGGGDFSAHLVDINGNIYKNS